MGMRSRWKYGWLAVHTGPRDTIRSLRIIDLAVVIGIIDALQHVAGALGGNQQQIAAAIPNVELACIGAVAQFACGKRTQCTFQAAADLNQCLQCHGHRPLRCSAIYTAHRQPVAVARIIDNAASIHIGRNTCRIYSNTFAGGYSNRICTYRNPVSRSDIQRYRIGLSAAGEPAARCNGLQCSPVRTQAVPFQL